MSDIHGLTSSLDTANGSGEINLVFHIPIDVNGNNPSGIGNYPIDETRVNSAPISDSYDTAAYNAELAAIRGDSGGPTNPSIYEHIETIDANDASNNATLISIIEARYSALSTSIPQRLAKQYRFYGVTRNVN